MRKYHLRKAQTLEDLPEWLFDEKERGKIAVLRNRNPEKVNVGADRNAGPEDHRDHVPPTQVLDNPAGSGHRQKLRSPCAIRNFGNIEFL